MDQVPIPLTRRAAIGVVAASAAAVNGVTGGLDPGAGRGPRRGGDRHAQQGRGEL